MPFVVPPALVGGERCRVGSHAPGLYARGRVVRRKPYSRGMTYPPSPRGRHWREDPAPDADLYDPPPERRRRYSTDYPPEDFPTDPTMVAPLNEAPPLREYHPPDAPPDSTWRRGTRDMPGEQLRSIRVTRRVDPTPVDVVVPRIYLEPDEGMDRLRRRSLVWAIIRDVLASVTLMYLIGEWLLVPLIRLIWP